jgi:hypothetical protein
MPPAELEFVVEFEVLYQVDQLACLECAPPQVVRQFAIDFHDLLVEAAEQPLNILNHAVQARHGAGVIRFGVPSENMHEGLKDDLGVIKSGSKAVNLRAG